MDLNLNLDLGSTPPAQAGGGGAEFDLETTLEHAEFYVNPTEANVTLGGAVLQTAALVGTVTGDIWCTGNGTITWDADALGSGKPGIVLAGADSGHNYLYTRANADPTYRTGSDFMQDDQFFIVVACYPDAISTNSANHYSNDRLIGGATSTFGMALRSTPIVQIGGDTSLGQITIDGPAVTVGQVNIITFRKDATKGYVSVNGGAETEGDLGDLTGMLTDIVVMGYSDGGGVGYAGKLGKMAIFKTTPDEATRTAIVAALKTFYGVA